MLEKTLPITEALYPGYSILFMFDNATSHLVYAEDALCTYKINKRSVSKQIISCNGLYINQIDMYNIQLMWNSGSKREQISKGIQKILTKRGL